MDISLNEVEMQATKAARGAGLAWGQAEDIGRAARWLAERGIDWARPLLGLLADAEARAAFAQASRVADDAATPEGAVVCTPLWMIPLLAMACRVRGAALTARWPTLCAGIGSDGRVSLNRRPAEIEMSPSPVRITPGQHEVLAYPLATGVRRGHLGAKQWKELDAFVTRTYVPSSFRSRAAGAGSGLTDND